MNTENNILIAEFLGLTVITEKEFLVYEVEDLENKYIDTTLKYDTDWNWLMLAVEKIESLKKEINSLDFQICIDRVAILVDAKPLYVNIEQFNPTSKISSVYNAVVEFVKYYNSAKEN